MLDIRIRSATRITGEGRRTRNHSHPRSGNFVESDGVGSLWAADARLGHQGQGPGMRTGRNVDSVNKTQCVALASSSITSKQQQKHRLRVVARSVLVRFAARFHAGLATVRLRARYSLFNGARCVISPDLGERWCGHFKGASRVPSRRHKGEKSLERAREVARRISGRFNSMSIVQQTSLSRAPREGWTCRHNGSRLF